MQSKFHDDASKRELTPQQRTGMARAGSDRFPEQEDQWAVLRHEVEAEDMRWQDEQAQAEQQGQWAQRGQPEHHERTNWEWPHDTEDDSFSSAGYAMPEQEENQVDIVVVGVGGAGMNAVNRMISTRVRGVRFVAMNTDAQVLSLSEAPARICLGQHYTKGLGAGGNASVGARAATESTAEIRAALGDADLVFIAAGMGGGTGTGGAPVVASIAKKLGALTIGIVTLPFSFEGTRRKRAAEEGLATLRAEVDAIITVPNDRLLSIIGRERSLADSFKIADDVLRQGVQGIAEVINVPGLVNVDFADVRSVLSGAGTALMSIGQGRGRNRAQQAAEEAIAGGFLSVSIRGAQRVLFNISGGEDMTLFEVNEVAEYIGNAIHDAADITFGAVIDPALDDVIRVTLIAAGMKENHTARIPAIQMDQQRVANAGPGFGPARSVQPTPRSPHGPHGQPEQQGPRGQPPRPGTMGTQAQIRPVSSGPPAPRQRPGIPASELPARQPARPTGRPQRSLDDLRGLRSLGRRHEGREAPRRDINENMLEGDDLDGVDVPPFLKKFTR